jgi:putative ABC transport system permease protein
VFRFTPYVLKSLWRHRTRSFLTVSGAAVALFVFCFVGAVQEGLDQLVRNAAAQNSLIVFQENRFCPITSRLPEDYAETIGGIEGVRDVIPLQVFPNNCRVSLDVIVFHGIPPEKLRSTRELKLTSGDLSAFEQRRDAALVGRRVAGRRNLSVGDSFSVGKIKVQVAGIFESSSAAEEALIYTHLKFLQETPGLDAVGLVTQLEVRLAPEADPNVVAKAIDEKLHAGPVPTVTRLKGVFQQSTLADLVDLIGFAHWLGYASVGLVLSIVATTTLMTVQDRVREHALLQTLGLRPGRVFRLVVAESLLLCLAGGLAGTVSALAVLRFSHLAVAAEGVTIAFEPSVHLGIVGVAASLLIGVIAGVAPGWHAADTPIGDVLREG